MNDGEKIVMESMNIIVQAGEARDCVMKSLDDIAANDFISAEKNLNNAKDKITAAHNIQTEIIQTAIREEEKDYNILFSHAQDTLMSITSEMNIADKLLGIIKNIDMRLKKLEK